MTFARHGMLSDREIECVRWASEGLSAKEIARQMNINMRTVETHLEHARMKIGGRNRTHAVVAAVRQGLI